MTIYGHEALSVLTNNASDYEEIGEGEQRKYNHTDCPSGEDTKSRLYVKNVDGAYMWHCHNCADSGYYRPRETASRIRENKAVWIGRSHETPVAHVTPKTTFFEEFDERGQRWLLEYGFDAGLSSLFSIFESNTGVVLPIWDDMENVGYQIRRYDMKPKYLTFTRAQFSYLNNNTEVLVLVEDLLSSYKLSAAGYSTLCLLGTKLDPKAFSKLLTRDKYKRVVIWLDDDEAGHKAGMRVFRDISPLIKDINAIFIEQPKEIPLDTLREMEL